MIDPILYLVMRNDLPSLNPGKLAAQAAHCANAFVASRRWRDAPLLKKWQKQSTQGFGTTIVLGAPYDFIASMDKSSLVYDDSYPCSIPAEIVHCLMDSPVRSPDWTAGISAGRGFFLRRELIGAYSFGEEKPDNLKCLELYP